MQLAAAGDRAALSELFLMHYAALHQHVTARLSPDVQGILVAEDVIQETFYRASQSIHRFEDRRGSIAPWLKTIAGNLIKDVQKRRRRERRADAMNCLSPRAGSDPVSKPLIERIGESAPSPSQIVRRSENAGLLREAIDKLPPDQREVLRRYYLLDESLEQIAQAMSRSKEAVRGICYRAKQNLRTAMGNSSQYLSG